MKKKVLSLILSTAMVASLAACGSTSADTTATTDTQTADTTSSDATATTSDTAAAADENFSLETINIVVDGTLTATVENGQDAFKAQWEEAVSEKLGHPITLNINQLDHSDYSGTVSRLLTTGEAGDGEVHRQPGELIGS